MSIIVQGSRSKALVQLPRWGSMRGNILAGVTYPGAGEVATDPDVITFVNRVEADGGQVVFQQTLFDNLMTAWKGTGALTTHAAQSLFSLETNGLRGFYTPAARKLNGSGQVIKLYNFLSDAYDLDYITNPCPLSVNTQNGFPLLAMSTASQQGGFWCPDAPNFFASSPASNNTFDIIGWNPAYTTGPDKANLPIYVYAGINGTGNQLAFHATGTVAAEGWVCAGGVSPAFLYNGLTSVSLVATGGSFQTWQHYWLAGSSWEVDRGGEIADNLTGGGATSSTNHSWGTINTALNTAGVGHPFGVFANISAGPSPAPSLPSEIGETSEFGFYGLMNSATNNVTYRRYWRDDIRRVFGLSYV